MRCSVQPDKSYKEAGLALVSHAISLLTEQDCRICIGVPPNKSGKKAGFALVSHPIGVILKQDVLCCSTRRFHQQTGFAIVPC